MREWGGGREGVREWGMEGVGEGGSEGVGSVKRGVMGSKGGDHLVLYEDNVGVEGGEGVRE